MQRWRDSLKVSQAGPSSPPQPYHLSDFWLYSIWASTFPAWSWLPASTYQGTFRDFAVYTSSNVCWEKTSGFSPSGLGAFPPPSLQIPLTDLEPRRIYAVHTSVVEVIAKGQNKVSSHLLCYFTHFLSCSFLHSGDVGGVRYPTPVSYGQELNGGPISCNSKVTLKLGDSRGRARTPSPTKEQVRRSTYPHLAADLGRW